MRWTGPVVLNGKLCSRLWLGCRDPRFKGAAGAIPKLFLLNWTAKPFMACGENYLLNRKKWQWLLFTCMALLVRVRSIDICPLRLENVPHISKPLPFSAGSQQALGGVYMVGADDNPKMSPRRPVVVDVAPPVSSGPPPSWKIIMFHTNKSLYILLQSLLFTYSLLTFCHLTTKKFIRTIINQTTRNRKRDPKHIVT